MVMYRVFYVGSSGKFFAVNDVDAESDTSIIAKAEELCAHHPNCTGIEIWDRARRVHVSTNAVSELL